VPSVRLALGLDRAQERSSLRRGASAAYRKILAERAQVQAAAGEV
jgi:hypothetical protein